MTGKERAALRAEANSLVPLFQIGKGGITEAVTAQIESAYNTRELIKIKVLLETSPVSPRMAADELAQKTGSEVIQVIGGVIVLYRINEELRKKAAEKKKREREISKKKKAVAKALASRTKSSPYKRTESAAQRADKPKTPYGNKSRSKREK